MAGAMARTQLPAWDVVTAGTHVIEGQPMSWRTRDAMAGLGFQANGHRSHQVSRRDVDASDLVVCFAPEHVAFIRRTYPEASGRTATIKRLCRDLPAAMGGVTDRVAVLDLAGVRLEPWEEVLDPAGGDIEVFERCALEVLDLTTRLARILTDR